MAQKPLHHQMFFAVKPPCANPPNLRHRQHERAQRRRPTIGTVPVRSWTNATSAASESLPLLSDSPKASGNAFSSAGHCSASQRLKAAPMVTMGSVLLPSPGSVRSASTPAIHQSRVTGCADRERFSRQRRSFGLSASRSQSPMMLTDNTSVTRPMAGNSVIHHSPENRYSLPMRINVPREGFVGGTPTPRKDSVASEIMASARPMVAMTRTGP